MAIFTKGAPQIWFQRSHIQSYHGTLYKSISTSILGMLSQPFNITNGTCQGCPAGEADLTVAPELAPEWPADTQRDYLTDTTLRLVHSGCLALCKTKGSDYLGLIWGKCRKLTILLKTWNYYKHCRKSLLVLLPSHLPPSIFSVDWRTD